MEKTFRNSEYPRDEFDAYFTEPWVTEVLLNKIRIEGDIWECACGDGRMAEVLKQNHHVICSDIKDYGYEQHTVDFLREGVDSHHYHGSIITNPPYKLADEFIERALRITEKHDGRVCMLLRNEFDCAKKRKWMFKDHPAFHMKIALTKRPKWFEGKKGSPMHNYAWYIWDWKSVHTKPKYDWS